MTTIMRSVLFVVLMLAIGACPYTKPPDQVNADSCVYYCWQRDDCEPFGSNCHSECSALLDDEGGQCREDFETLIICTNDAARVCDDSYCCEFCVEEAFALKVCLDPAVLLQE